MSLTDQQRREIQGLLKRAVEILDSVVTVDETPRILILDHSFATWDAYARANNINPRDRRYTHLNSMEDIMSFGRDNVVVWIIGDPSVHRDYIRIKQMIEIRGYPVEYKPW